MAKHGSLIFAPGITQQIIQVAVIENTARQFPRNIQLTLGNLASTSFLAAPTAMTITAAGHIADNDGYTNFPRARLARDGH